MLKKGEKIVYPASHQVGVKVPQGGSSCASCKYLKPGIHCGQEYFVEWNGSEKIPTKSADTYCCDLWEHREGKRSAGELMREQKAGK